MNVTVWSRGGVPAELQDLGLRLAASPRAAATGADIVLSMVTDDEASRSLWSAPGSGALEGIERGALAVECSTLTPEWVRSLGAHVEAKGARFLDAPVIGSRPQAEAGALVHLLHRAHHHEDVVHADAEQDEGQDDVQRGERDAAEDRDAVTCAAGDDGGHRITQARYCDSGTLTT